MYELTNADKEEIEDVDWRICLRCGHDMDDLLDMADNTCGCDCHDKLVNDIKEDGELNIIMPEDGVMINVRIDEEIEDDDGGKE